MRIRSPSLSELHAFARAAESGSLTRAADALSVTQGAVSRAVLRLEADLGVTLLERNASGVQPTAAGRRYLDEIRPALAALEHAAATVKSPAKRHTLNICAIPTLNTRWLVPRLARFQTAHPELSLAFTPYVVEEDYLRDDVDCWIQTRRSASSRWPRHVLATYIVGREIVAICPPAIAATLRNAVDLLRHPLLHHVNYPDNWRVWLRAAGIAEASVRDIRLGAGFDLVAAMTEAVAAGMGVAVVQRCLIERELRSGQIAVPFATIASTGRGYYLCVPRSRADAPAVAAFSAWLRVEAAGTEAS